MLGPERIESFVCTGVERCKSYLWPLSLGAVSVPLWALWLLFNARTRTRARCWNCPWPHRPPIPWMARRSRWETSWRAGCRRLTAGCRAELASLNGCCLAVDRPRDTSAAEQKAWGKKNSGGRGWCRGVRSHLPQRMSQGFHDSPDLASLIRLVRMFYDVFWQGQRVFIL